MDNTKSEENTNEIVLLEIDDESIARMRSYFNDSLNETNDSSEKENDSKLKCA